MMDGARMYRIAFMMYFSNWTGLCMRFATVFAAAILAVRLNQNLPSIYALLLLSWRLPQMKSNNGLRDARFS